MGSVVIKGNRGEVGVTEFVVSDISTVDLELELVGIRHDVHGTRVRRREILDRVVEVEFLDLRTGSDRFLNLGDEHILRLRSEDLTLLGVEVRVVGVDLPLILSSTSSPSDAELDIVVLERYEGESRLPVLTESEAEGVETLVSGTTVEVTSDRLGRGSGR